MTMDNPTPEVATEAAPLPQQQADFRALFLEIEKAERERPEELAARSAQISAQMHEEGLLPTLLLDGVGEGEHADEIEFKNADGESYYMDQTGVIRGEDGKIYQVHYKDGGEQTFTYDEETGELATVTNGSGEDAVTWTYDKNSKTWSDGKGHVSDAKNSIGPNGEFIIEYPDGRKETWNQDNTAIIEGADGSTTYLDDQSRPVKIVKGADVAIFDYADDGTLKRAIINGEVFRQQNGKEGLYDANGQRYHITVSPRFDPSHADLIDNFTYTPYPEEKPYQPGTPY